MCLSQGADLHMAQLMPLPLTITCSSKSRLALPFWCWLTWQSQDGHKTAVCVCVCERVHTISYSTFIETMHLLPFSSYNSYLLDIADFNLPYLHLVPPLGVSPTELHQGLTSKN